MNMKTGRPRRTASTADVECDRFWDPINPTAPHVRLLRRGEAIGIEFVPFTGLPEFFLVSAQSALQLARASYAFAEEYAAYAVKSRRLEYATMQDRIEDLEDSVASKDRLIDAADRILEEEIERADRYSVVLENLVSGLTTIAASNDEDLDLFRDSLRRLAGEARDQERNESDGSQIEIHQETNQNQENERQRPH